MGDYHTIIRFKASPAGEPGYVDESDINGDLSALLKKKDLCFIEFKEIPGKGYSSNCRRRVKIRR